MDSPNRKRTRGRRISCTVHCSLCVAPIFLLRHRHEKCWTSQIFWNFPLEKKNLRFELFNSKDSWFVALVAGFTGSAALHRTKPLTSNQTTSNTWSIDLNSNSNEGPLFPIITATTRRRPESPGHRRCVIHLNIHPNRWHPRPCLATITFSCSFSSPWNPPCPASSGTPNTPTSLLRFATQPTPLNTGRTTHRRQKYGQSNSLAIQKNNVACHWHPTPWT